MALFLSCNCVPESSPCSVPNLNGSLQEARALRVSFPQSNPRDQIIKSSNTQSAHAMRAPGPSCVDDIFVAMESSVQSAELWELEESIVEDKDEEWSSNLSTELNRSQLERQWSRRGERPHNGQTLKKRKVFRLSARQRRIMSRRDPKRCRRSEPKALDRVKSAMPHTEYDAFSLPITHGPNSTDESLVGTFDSVNTVGFTRRRGSKGLLTKEEETLLAKRMKEGQNLRAARERLIEAIGHEPSDELWAQSVKLTCQELRRKILEADQARDHMFQANLRLVVSVAKNYSSLGINLDDLTQEGAVGLLRGLEKFNYKKGFKLSTYVHWWIRQGITQALGEHSKTVRIPPYTYAKLASLLRTMERLKESGVPVSVTNLSVALNMPEDVVSSALKASKKMISLDKPKNWGDFSSDGDSMHNYVADPHAEYDPWKMLDKSSLREQLDALMASTLCKREQEIVRLYYGFECPKQQGLPFHRIGQRLGMSRERARQLEVRALRKLVVAGKKMSLGIPLSY
ncbi:hypothetical protein KP509_02G009200 [Ceratopteris richardii]|uniref:Sigma factor n=1 Tax=Ceratopteris richardii TaxID=49495 RepID=A0A8T2VAH0_CERRI|nr:hypothetical protein KP509_02G009200 [Ceratopteris richardii]